MGDKTTVNTVAPYTLHHPTGLIILLDFTILTDQLLLVCLPSAVQWPVLVAALPSAGLQLLPEPPPAAASLSEAAAGRASGGRTASAQDRLTERRKNVIQKIKDISEVCDDDNKSTFSCNRMSQKG